MSDTNDKSSVIKKSAQPIVDQWLKMVLELKLEGFVYPLIEAFGRVEIFGQLAYTTVDPILTLFYGKSGDDAAGILLEPRQSAIALYKRLQELEDEKSKEIIFPIKQNSQYSSLSTKIKSWFSKKSKIEKL